MTLRSHSPGCTLAALLLTACSAPEGCFDRPETLSVDVEEASVVLTRAGDAVLRAYEAELTGLPELWPAGGPIVGAGFMLTLSLAYETPPAAGTVEMPRLRVAFGASASETPSYPPASLTFGTALFSDCESGRSCCPRGALECRSTVDVRIERLDGPRFPPVSVSFRGTARATVNDCPIRGEPVSFTFQPVEP